MELQLAAVETPPTSKPSRLTMLVVSRHSFATFLTVALVSLVTNLVHSLPLNLARRFRAFKELVNLNGQAEHRLPGGRGLPRSSLR